MGFLLARKKGKETSLNKTTTGTLDPVDPSGGFDDFSLQCTNDRFVCVSLISSFFAARTALIALELAYNEVLFILVMEPPSA